MRLTPLVIFVSLSFGCLSQSGYNLQFKIDGLKDTTAYLAFTYGETSYIKDTATVNTKGEFIFEGNQTLPHGFYFVVMNKTKLFDVLVGNNQHFFMQTKTEDYIRNMVVKGDVDNTLFYEGLMHIPGWNKESEPFVKIVRDSTLKEEQKKAAREALTKLNDKVSTYYDGIIAKHPSTITARLHKSRKPILVPDPPKKANGSIDSTFQLRWYRQHFFDNFDLGDEIFLRMPEPVYKEKMNEYLDKLLVQQPDSLMKGINFILSKAKKNQETYQYAARICIIKYQSHEIMGLDEVYVNLYDQYFASGEMDFWATESTKKMLREQADRLRKSLIGRTGPNLIMQDSNFKPRALYDIKSKYTVIYIFDPDCGHCKEETPKLVNFYNRNKQKLNVEVYAVSADTSMTKMRDYIKEMDMKWITVNGPRSYVGSHHDLYDAMTTPTIYILDSKRKIIGKKIGAEHLEDFLMRYEAIEKRKAASKL